MYEKLLNLQKNSYSPYSNYAVSAIVVMKDGKEFPGVNVENASFGELHVMTSSKDVGYPCFICRQVIEEFFKNDDLIYCYSKEGKVEKHPVSDMCTYPFGEDDLK